MRSYPLPLFGEITPQHQKSCSFPSFSVLEMGQILLSPSEISRFSNLVTQTKVTMAESLHIPQSKNRQEIYQALLPQIQAVIADEEDLIANLANITAMLKEAFGFFWVGFYWVKNGELVLGPFQGSLACTRIAFDRGVCGHAYSTGKTVLVPDVDQFPGHIACSSLARSEVVVPVFDFNQKVIGVLDVDSEQLNDFSSVDTTGLESVIRILEKKIKGDLL